MGKKILNVLYFTLEDFESIKDGHSINKDLLREFQRHGHNIYAVSPTERRRGLPTRLIRDEDDKSNESNKCYECDDCCKNDKHAKHGRNSKNGSVVILKPRIGNIQKTKNFIEKGISTLTIGWILKQAIKKYLSDVKFDLIIYCTPPITFLTAIEYVKKRDGARTYLLLKDIFPDSAVDLGVLKKSDLTYRYFRWCEKRFYAISDHIGCMSRANVDYVLKHNPEIRQDIVEVCPNCIEVFDKNTDEKTRIAIRKKHALPLDKKIFVYGGNLGIPQGISFVIECLRACVDLDCYFLIVGDGTDRHLLVEYIEERQPKQPKNIKLIEQLPQDEYTQLVSACDVGLIFLDHRFTIPNFPSRLLTYMMAKLPVLACTDPYTDIGNVIVGGGFGWWCESDDPKMFRSLIISILKENLASLKNKSHIVMCRFYSTELAYNTILGETVH